MSLGLDSGHVKAVVPWGTIGSQQEDFIEDQFLPFGFNVQKDPSKMNKSQILELLEYWYKRQNNPKVPVSFRFKAYKCRATGEIIQVDRKGKGKAGNTRTSGKKGKTGKRSKQDEEQVLSAHNTESDSTADTDSNLGSDTDSNDSEPKSGVNQSGRKAEPRGAAEARMRKLKAARERALQQEKKKFLEEMKANNDPDDDAGTSGPRGKKRTLDVESDGDHHSDKGDSQKSGKNKEAKLESLPRRTMTTRSRGAADSTGLTDKRRARRGGK